MDCTHPKDGVLMTCWDAGLDETLFASVECQACGMSGSFVESIAELVNRYVDGDGSIEWDAE